MVSPNADVKRVCHKSWCVWLLTLATWLAFVSPSPAQVDGWGTNGGPGTPPTTYTSQSAFGVTLGTNALQATTPQGSFWGPSTGNLVAAGPQNAYSALANATQISFDLTLLSAQINGGSGAFNGFAQSNELAIQLFSAAGGTFPTQLNIFEQQNFTNAGISDSLGQNAGWNGVDGTRTIKFDLTKFTGTDTDGATKTIGAILLAHPDMQSAQIDFVEQAGNGTTTVGPANFFFDNVRLLDSGGNTLAIIGNFEPVPEPSSIALAALAIPALVGAVRRRRRRLRASQVAANAAPVAP
jgi:PEP-CTERM motif